MKRYSFLIGLTLACIAGGSALLLNSCADDDYWPYSPPPGWGSNYFYDTRLDGAWELVQANSTPVGRYDTNYLDFYGGGHGRYYYYHNSQPLSEDMAYYCQRSNSNTTNYQINIQYESGGASTMAYWFTDNENSLWLQWQTNGGRVVTYLYTRTGNVPW